MTYRDFAVNTVAKGILLNGVVPVLAALGIVVFIWGIMKYIRAGENAAERSKGQKYIIAGLIGIMVMVTVYGLIKIITKSIGHTKFGIPQIGK
jgi:hypothetical protein